MKDENSGKEPLLKFPTDITLKIIGKGDNEFESAVLMIVHQHFPNFADRAMQTRNSENGKYRALSITIYVESKEEIDNLYQDLTACKHVIMAL